MNQLGIKANILTKILTTSQYSSRRLPRVLSQSLKREASSHSSKKESEEEVVTEKFSESGAAKWKSFDTFSVPQVNQNQGRPRAEPYVISVSISIFLIYFLYLREENDLDLDLDKPLYERLPTLERAQIKAQIRNYEREGLDTKELQLRLQQLNKEIRKRQE